MAADHQKCFELPKTKYLKVLYSEFKESSFLCGSSLCTCGSLYQYVLYDTILHFHRPQVTDFRLSDSRITSWAKYT